MSKLLKKLNKKYSVILRHELREYDFCVKESHIHHATLSFTSSDFLNLSKKSEISHGLQSIDFIIEMEDNTFTSTIEKFMSFCQDYLVIDSAKLEILHDDEEYIFEVFRED